MLAKDKVYFLGHPIAAVVATSRYVARDAADLLMVDYDELPVVTDVEGLQAARSFTTRGATTSRID